MAARRRFRPTARRKMVWARTGDQNVPDATGDAVDLLANFRDDGGSTIGATITRVHISLALAWTNVQADLAGNRLVLGALVDQRDQPETQVPRPAVELHADWMYWAAHPLVPEYSALGAPFVLDPGPSNLNTSLWLDIKSQRKCEELGDTLWFVMDPTFAGSPTPNGDTILSIEWSASVLLKLP